MSKNSQPKEYVLLAGGLSAGPIVPLLAVVEEWQKSNGAIKPVVVDLKHSVAARLAKERQLQFERIITGKLRRYWTWQTIFLPLLGIIGFIMAVRLMQRYRPVAVLGAGGFVQLPLVLAAWCFRIPRFIHQQDVAPTLTNSLSAPFANKITVTFESSIRDFPQGTGLGKKYIATDKVLWTGNPVLTTFGTKHISKSAALKQFGLHTQLPVLLVVGGGTGAAGINKLLYRDLPALTEVVQVLHSTGVGKQEHSVRENYHPYEFISNIEAAYQAADVVLSRAGLGSLSSLAYAKKPAIIIPMPNTHQEANAQLLFTRKAAIVLDESETTVPIIISSIRKLLFEPSTAKTLVKNLESLFPLHASHKVVKVIVDYLHQHEASHKR